MDFTIGASKDLWTLGADSYFDRNRIHRDSDYAKSKGLQDVVAPGMWVVSHVQGAGQVQKLESTFKEPVYENDSLVFSGINSGEKFEVRNSINGNLNCSGKVVFGNPDGQNLLLPQDIQYVYSTSVNPSNVLNFLVSLRLGSYQTLPEMYFASLSAPALLSYGEKEGKTGVHVSQSFTVHKPLSLGRLDIFLSEGERSRQGGRLRKVDLYWVSQNNLVASGRALIVPIAKA